MNGGTLAIGAGQDVLAHLLAAPEADVVAIIPAPATAAERQLIAAAVAVAAERRAPAMRVNAVLTGPSADETAIAGAVAFLRSAPATTGQTLDVD